MERKERGKQKTKMIKKEPILNLIIKIRAIFTTSFNHFERKIIDSKPEKTKESKNYYIKIEPDTPKSKPIDPQSTPPESQSKSDLTEEPKNIDKELKEAALTPPLIITNDFLKSNSKVVITGDWLIVGGSSIGKSHVESKMPCQDNFFLSAISENLGIAVVCDGAGSAKNSQLGSKFVSERVALIFSQMVESEIGLESIKSLSEEQWSNFAKRGLFQARKDLEEYSLKEDLKFESLACTVIVVIYHPHGILITHIGDGRAGYLSKEKGWLPLMIPFKGEEANETVFITSKIWSEKDIDTYLEAKVFIEEYSGFTLMSDGCESHSYLCSIFDEDSQTWTDPNMPFSRFFDPMMDGLKIMRDSGLSPAEIESKWIDFLRSGTKGISNEPDDKTLVLAVLKK
ncbi:PP2C family serine/threonine-protein phosphatase [Rhodonellum psychrophilum]|nr:PP2C family serine/threonine-protein phosphatase [Rhodonellum psychrophilum]